MGMSASQARLLTITARLTSNEYESQQISNAKMRLAVRSEEASAEYIRALDTQQVQFMSYNAQGDAIATSVTPNAIYQYADMKNQYLLTNPNGQALIASDDAKKFKESNNLDEFLEKYGIYKIYKSPELGKLAETLYSTSENGGVSDYYEEWCKAKDWIISNYATYTGQTSDIEASEAYQNGRGTAFNNFQNALIAYQSAKDKYAASATDDNYNFLNNTCEDLSTAKIAYTDYMTFENWIADLAKKAVSDGAGGYIQSGANGDIYNNVEKYYGVLSEYIALADDLEVNSINETYTYSDGDKAQWYTNLWYRLNGESSDKSTFGKNETGYKVLDTKLADSNQWLQDALIQGVISLEVATYKDETNEIPDLDNPTRMNLRGISWNSTIYSSCSDFTQQDDDKAIARAEAEYQRKNNEIAAIDKKYQNQLKSLDTEHNTLQTQYDSIQSELMKNIDRSFKTFSG